MKPNYWFVGYSDASFEFFRDEDPLTEEEWREDVRSISLRGSAERDAH